MEDYLQYLANFCCRSYPLEPDYNHHRSQIHDSTPQFYDSNYRGHFDELFLVPTLFKVIH